MKRRDTFLIIIIFIIAVSFFAANRIINSGSRERIEIYVGNRLYKKIPVTDKKETVMIKQKGNTNEIYIHDRGVEMKEANCHDRICVKTGFINKPGQSIVCLPHRINIKIVSDDSSKNVENINTN